MHNIRHIQRADLDVVKWDACIEASPNGLIYAHSFYLDIMSDHWDALVLDDYAVVMPLPWRNKWGIRYVYQPPFMQRLGLFGNGINNDLEEAFYQLAIQKFKFIHYNVSSLPPIDKVVCITRKNLIIDLTVGYPTIEAQYDEEAVKNIRKAQNRGCQFATNINGEDVILHFIRAYGALNKRLTEHNFYQFSSLIEVAQSKGNALVCGVKDDQQELIFSAVILKDNKRLYYVLGAPTPLGRAKRAPYFFINHLLQSYAGQNLVFDFEGSDIPNVAHFYQHFTQTIEPYYEIKINRLPWPARWLKS